MKRLVFLLAALAVLLAPLTMIGGGAAMAMSHGMAAEAGMDHCAGMDEPSKDQPRGDIECMMACAAIAPLASRFEARLMAPAPLPRVLAATEARGLDPEAETPPPRSS